ncbi:putative high-affinity nicotinic acid transporter protein [Phaeoacremonium minimum UCRPA7]|uniref:Putative high-affinity nicotinic acid transporter protein n=1 Tax=Phaeoacremonium minimum (strain UCR-PA7) TaxID=1286976 RepID=R8BHY9_PHAM7|nr:putative high-affinity nicotinic acid transporter protein [Phaeoacremonium minimum UCRPA7]EON98884.1 putative high-affinity nicotinic acid transporter protein [Phaeoacremonium minimum UCRPA7]
MPEPRLSRPNPRLCKFVADYLQNYAGFVVCRLLLGICESAFFPSLNLYVSMFWKREEIAKRAILLMVSMSLAGAFGGLLAYALTQLDGVGGYSGWRWLYFIEGLISFAFGIATYWLFPDNPETAYFSNEEERKAGKERLMKRGNYEDVHPSIHTFLPNIVKGLGNTGLQTQYLTIPIYISGAIGVIAAGYLADRFQ